MIRNARNSCQEKSWLVYEKVECHKSLLCLFVLHDTTITLFDVFLGEYRYKFNISYISQISRCHFGNILRFNVNDDEHQFQIESEDKKVLNEIIAHVYIDKAGFASQKIIKKLASSLDKFTVLRSYNEVPDIILKLNHTDMTFVTNDLSSSQLFTCKLWLLNGIHWQSSTEVVLTIEDVDDAISFSTFDAYQLNMIVLHLLSRASYHNTREYNSHFTSRITPKPLETETFATFEETESKVTQSPKQIDSSSFTSTLEAADTTESLMEPSEIAKFEPKKLNEEEHISFIEEMISRKQARCITQCNIA